MFVTAKLRYFFYFCKDFVDKFLKAFFYMNSICHISRIAPGVSFGWFVPSDSEDCYFASAKAVGGKAVSAKTDNCAPVPAETDECASVLVKAAVCPAVNTEGNGALVVPERIVLPQQTHTCRFGVVRSPEESFPETDALVTGLRGVAIGVRTADCIPLVVYAPDIKMIAAIHAGWRGTIEGIAPYTVGYMLGQGASMSAIQVRFGPGICGACYEVSQELADRFSEAGFRECVKVAPERPHLDLVAANILSLRCLGIPEANIVAPEVCTLHSRLHDSEGNPALLPSWRREAGIRQRLVTWIRMD